MPDTQQPVVLKRRYAASIDVVFRTLVEKELLEQWLSPSPDVPMTVLEHDPRIGGRYRLHFCGPDGKVNIVGGTYKTIDPPRCVAFTWRWDPPSDHVDFDSLVTIELAEVDGQTQLTLTHTLLPDLQTVESHTKGWTGALDRLHTHLTA